MVAVEAVETSVLEARALAGDAAAFGELIRGWDPDFRGVVWTVVRSAAGTDDVMQASYEKAFRTIDRFNGQAPLKIWLHTVCLRAAIEHSRTAPQPLALDADGLGSSPADAVPDDAASPELARVFDSLDRVDQVLLMLTSGLGYSFDDTATIVGLPRGTVTSRVGKARVQIRNGTES